MPMWAAAGGALLGGIGGAMKKGPAFSLSQYGQEAQGNAQGALAAYKNLTAAGPNAMDVTNAREATAGFSNQLQQAAASPNGLYNFQAGRSLAEQQYAGQRESLNQSFQDQLVQANRAAAMSGRGANDPILRARLAQDQTRQQAQLSANQNSAAVGFARQSGMDSLQLGQQRVGLLQGYAQQAFQNQGNLFQMNQGAYNSEFQNSLALAGYEASRGGGLQGALTGVLTGAGAGLKAGQGLGAGAGPQQASALNQAPSGIGYESFGSGQGMFPNAFSAVAPAMSSPNPSSGVMNFAPQGAALAPSYSGSRQLPMFQNGPSMSY